MQRLTFYILRQLITGTVLVTVGLLCILWLTQSLRFVELIVTRGVSVGSFLHLTGLLLPNFLLIILPVALFAVVLFTYNKLKTDREIVVLQAAGISPLGLARPALLMAIILTGIGYAMSLYYVPLSVRDFKELQWSLRNDVSRLLIQEGAFTQVAPGITVYVKGRTDSDELLGLLVHDTRTPDETTTLLAERGALVHGDNGPTVLMVNGSRHSVSKGTGNLSLLYFDSYTLEIATGGTASGPRIREARERSNAELLTLEVGDEEHLSAVDIRRFRVEAHQRLVNPLAHIGFALVAIAALLTGSFDRRGSGKRIVGAIGVLVLSEAAMIGSANMAAKSLTYLPLIYVSVLLPLAGALIMLFQPRMFSPNRLQRQLAR